VPHVWPQCSTNVYEQFSTYFNSSRSFPQDRHLGFPRGIAGWLNGGGFAGVNCALNPIGFGGAKPSLARGISRIIGAHM
jgi:hypothetical protein